MCRFRWVQCQLDEISKLRTNKAIKAALKALPETLEASYSRNVLRINEGDLIYAYQALLWLTYALYPLKLNTLAEATVLEQGATAVEDESRLSDPTDILDICGMLAFYNDLSDEVQLSHHSVREFLSASCKIPFSFPEKPCHRTIAERSISYLLNDDFATGPLASSQSIKTTLTKYPLLAYAARSWPTHVLRSDAEEALQPLILQLLTPEATPHFYFWLQIVLYHSNHGFQIPGTKSPYSPTALYYASSYGLYNTVKSLIALGADLNVRAGRYGGTALHAACWRQRPGIIQLLLGAGADTIIGDSNGMTAFDLTKSGVGREYYQIVTRNQVVDEALRAVYLQKQADESVGRKLGDQDGWRTRTGLRVKQPQSLNRPPPTNLRKLGDGETFELE